MELLAHQAAVLMIAIMQVVTLNLAVGKVGVWSIGHLAFFAIGSFAAAEVLSATGGSAFAILPAIAAAAAAAGVASVVIGLATLRLQQDFFVILSLAFVVLVRNVVLAWKGPDGMLGVPRPHIGSLVLADNWTAVLLVLLPMALLVVGVAVRFARLPIERACALVRSHEDAARLLGRSPFYYRLGTFVLASTAVGVAGAGSVLFHGSAGVASFSLSRNLELFAAMLLGGRNSVSGSLIGGVLLVVLPRLLTEAIFVGPTGSYYAAQGTSLVFGLLLIVIIRVVPGGLAGTDEGLNR